MQLPIEITYRGVEKSDEIDKLIRSKAERLDRFCDHISRCDIAVEQPNHSQRAGNPFRVRIDVTVPPGHELVADEKQTEHEMHEPLTKIINDAFKTMERQLKDLVERQRHEVKTHAEPRALVTKLFPDYGFITDGGGVDIYFHRNAVLNVACEEVKVGAEVRFDLSHGEMGPQASSVHIVSTGGPRL
ncbi:MAG: HPF/RaiA family ribosome-associated protein [Verrucomicrobiota bacterium]|nr:HPF/RaiA family ribosome-associated protein [Verrucomicrobiota bacterium]